MTPEHKAKIRVALKAYYARPDSHLRRLHQEMTGERHPRFKNGTNVTYYRRVAFAHYGRACTRCGSTRNLNVHHRDEDRTNYTIENLDVLCRSCHNREHGLGGAHGVQS